jgi:hypothetical protein
MHGQPIVGHPKERWRCQVCESCSIVLRFASQLPWCDVGNLAYSHPQIASVNVASTPHVQEFLPQTGISGLCVKNLAHTTSNSQFEHVSGARGHMQDLAQAMHIDGGLHV